MTLSEIFRQAVATFRAHKLRTFLTMFGLVWGIASVIILVGLGRGFVVDQKKHMPIPASSAKGSKSAARRTLWLE